MPQSPFPLSTIIEDDKTYDWETSVDLVRLKRFRTTGKSTHKKSGNRLRAAIRVVDDCDTVRQLQTSYVRDYEELEGIHGRFLRLLIPNLSPVAIISEQNWLHLVMYDHKAVLAFFDDGQSTKPHVSVRYVQALLTCLQCVFRTRKDS